MFILSGLNMVVLLTEVIWFEGNNGAKLLTKVAMNYLQTLTLFDCNICSTVYLYVRNPFLKSYYALSDNQNKLGKLLIKIIPPLYLVIDGNSHFSNLFVSWFC